MRRVVVTRPMPAAHATAKRLQDAGFEPVVMPLTQIVPCPGQSLPPVPCDGVAATSANALRHASQSMIATLVEKPLFAVGDATAQAAREAGFRHVECAGKGDAKALASAIIAQPKPFRNVLYLAGTPRTGHLELGLQGAGIAIAIVETYRAVPVSYGREEVRAMLVGEAADAVLVYSAHAAERLAGLARQFLTRQERARLCCYGISTAATAPLRDMAPHIVVAHRPDEEAVLAALTGSRSKD